MSHTTKIKDSAIKDVKAIRTAVQRLKIKRGVNCSLLENTTPRMYYRGQSEKCDFVLKLHDSKYDVGFNKQEDGSYEVMMDTWDGQVKSQLGGDWKSLEGRESSTRKHIGKFYEEYAIAEVQNACAYDGDLSFEDFHVDDEGRIHMAMTHIG